MLDKSSLSIESKVLLGFLDDGLILPSGPRLPSRSRRRRSWRRFSSSGLRTLLLSATDDSEFRRGRLGRTTSGGSAKMSVVCAALKSGCLAWRRLCSSSWDLDGRWPFIGGMAFRKGGLFSKLTGLVAVAGVGRATGSFTGGPSSKARFCLRG